MSKNIRKEIGLILLCATVLCLSGCTVKAEKTIAGETTENTEITEQAQEKQLYEYTEADFLALSETYRKNGELDMARETLIEMHRWFPSKENADRISEVIVQRDASDTAVAALLNAACAAIENGSAEEVKTLTQSEEWQQEFWDALVGVSRKTKYAGEAYAAQIISDCYATEIMLLKDDHTFLYYKQNPEGIILGKTAYIEGAYSGDYRLIYRNAEGEELMACQGTFQTNLSTGTFMVTYQGTNYTGELSDAGTTLVEQKKKVTDAGNVIYAYNASKSKYLYKENETVETFVIDAQYLGLPVYKEW